MAFQASGFGPLVNQAPHSLLAYCPEDVSAAQSKGSQGGQGPEARHARELSTAATPTKRATLFLHFSGCGGTSVADFARKLHVFTMPPKTSSKNANFGCAAEQFCHNATLTATRRCPCADTQRAAARGLTWWANENPSLAPLRCPSVSYWTVIRDPVDRIFSRLFKPANKKLQPGSTLRFLTLDEAKRALGNVTYFPAVDAFGKHYGEFASSFGLSNWMTRSLGGPDVFALPFEQLNKDHLALARGELTFFDVVLPLSSLSALPTLLSLLWAQCITTPMSDTVSRAHSGSTEASAAMLRGAKSDKTFTAALRKANLLDTALYQGVKDNFASKFAQPTRNPKWPCSRKETEGALGRPTSAQRVMLSPNPTLGPIPRIFHVIWPNKNLSFPGKPREEEKARYWNKHLQDVNPGWEMRVWTDDECEQLVTRKFPGFLAAWKALTPKLKMWDAIRPIILHTHGGIYLDVDVQCNRAFEPLLENASLLLRANFHPDKYKGPAMGNHIMGSAPHHPLWLNYLAGIERTHASDPKSKVTQRAACTLCG